jgi:hypothetical protein
MPKEGFTVLLPLAEGPALNMFARKVQADHTMLARQVEICKIWLRPEDLLLVQTGGLRQEEAKALIDNQRGRLPLGRLVCARANPALGLLPTLPPCAEAWQTQDPGPVTHAQAMKCAEDGRERKDCHQSPKKLAALMLEASEEMLQATGFLRQGHPRPEANHREEVTAGGRSSSLILC